MSDSEKKWNPIRLPANFDSVKFMDYACDFDFRRFLLALKTPIPAMLLTCIPSLIKNSLQIESSYLVFSVNKLNLYFWVSIDVSENIRLRPTFIAHYLILLNKLTRVHLFFRSLDDQWMRRGQQRLLKSCIPSLFLIPSRHLIPTNNLIPILLLVHVARERRRIQLMDN